MADHRTVALGRLPAHPASRSKRVPFVALLTGDLPEPAPARDYTCGATSRPMWANATVGDCTCVAIASMFAGWLRLVYGFKFTPSDTDVLALYSAVTGYDPAKVGPDGSNPTDRGAVIEDVLAYVEAHGFLNHHLIGSAAVDPSDIKAIQRAIDWFGAVDLGVNLPKAWQGQKRWEAPTFWQKLTARSSWAAGSWGGHCVCSQKYDADGLYVWTWGELIFVSWAAVAAYFDTVDVVLSATWLREGKSPAGLDEATLRQRMAALREGA